MYLSYKPWNHCRAGAWLQEFKLPCLCSVLLDIWDSFCYPSDSSVLGHLNLQTAHFMRDYVPFLVNFNYLISSISCTIESKDIIWLHLEMLLLFFSLWTLLKLILGSYLHARARTQFSMNLCISNV